MPGYFQRFLRNQAPTDFSPKNEMHPSNCRGEQTYLLRAPKIYILRLVADVAELADALDSKSGIRKDVWVRPPPSAPTFVGFGNKSHCNSTTDGLPVVILFSLTRSSVRPRVRRIICSINARPGSRVRIWPDFTRSIPPRIDP